MTPVPPARHLLRSRNRGKLAFAALLTLTAIGGGACSFALAGGSEARALPRATTDRPDDLPGQSQVHIVYAIPSDGADRSLDVDGTLLRTVTSWNTWLAAQTGGRNFRLDTAGGQLDITFVRLPQADAQIEATGAYVPDQTERDLHSLGFMQSGKIYAVYYDGRSNWSCGGGAWPPTLVGEVAALYLRGLYGGPVPCDTNRFGEIGNPQYLEFSMIHEIMHTLGFVPTCAPHQTRAGHVSGPRTTSCTQAMRPGNCRPHSTLGTMTITVPTFPAAMTSRTASSSSRLSQRQRPPWRPHSRRGRSPSPDHFARSGRSRRSSTRAVSAAEVAAPMVQRRSA